MFKCTDADKDGKLDIWGLIFLDIVTPSDCFFLSAMGTNCTVWAEWGNVMQFPLTPTFDQVLLHVFCKESHKSWV